MRQRVIRLTDDKNFSRLMAAAARYQNLQTVPRVKRIEDPPLSLLIPGSMSLPRPASASHGSLQRLATKPAAIIARCSITASQSSSKISPWRAAMAVIRASCVRSTAPTFSFILDDWGLEPFDAPARHDILEILEERYGRRSTIVTSNSPRTAGIKSSTTQPTPMRSSTVSFTTPIGSNWLAKACDASGQVAKKSQMKA